jgi:hypothetical protein
MTFGVSLCMIGLVTMIVGEAAAAFGCFCGLEDSITGAPPDPSVQPRTLRPFITHLPVSSRRRLMRHGWPGAAITFVALGTSLPDLFASQHAAKDDSSADASIGNVTGSNSVNVFLGLGLPWVIATIYSLANPSTDPARAANPNGYYVPKEGGLSFSVTIFAIMALICISTLMLRRKVVGAELGGGKCGGRITALFFVGLWCDSRRTPQAATATAHLCRTHPQSCNRLATVTPTAIRRSPLSLLPRSVLLCNRTRDFNCDCAQVHLHHALHRGDQEVVRQPLQLLIEAGERSATGRNEPADACQH